MFTSYKTKTVDSWTTSCVTTPTSSFFIYNGVFTTRPTSTCFVSRLRPTRLTDMYYFGLLHPIVSFLLTAITSVFYCRTYTPCVPGHYNMKVTLYGCVTSSVSERICSHIISRHPTSTDVSPVFGNDGPIPWVVVVFFASFCKHHVWVFLSTKRTYGSSNGRKILTNDILSTTDSFYSTILLLCTLKLPNLIIIDLNNSHIKAGINYIYGLPYGSCHTETLHLLDT